ncbi:MAG: metalloregulator ArsR/SmtB family transcription factor [Clostridia bacterium]
MKEHEVFLKVIAEENRSSIIKTLSRNTCCASKIAEELNLNNTTLAYHLSMLKENGIVNCIRKGKNIFYTLDRQALQNAFTRMYDYIAN